MLLGGGEGGPGGSDCSGSIWKVLSHHAVWCTHNTVSLQGMTSTISQALTFSDQGQRGCRTSLQPIRADGDPCLGDGDPPILRTTWGYSGQLLSSLVFTAADPATGRWGRCDEGTGGSLHLDQLHSVAHVSMQDKQYRPPHWNHVGSYWYKYMAYHPHRGHRLGQCQYLHIWKEWGIPLISSEFSFLIS